MQTHHKIKIIKRVERDLRQEQTQAADEPKGQAQRPAAAATVRDAVTTITGWIGELRQKKDAEVAEARVLLSSLSRA